jgi:hypothetical protein
VVLPILVESLISPKLAGFLSQLCSRFPAD